MKRFIIYAFAAIAAVLAVSGCLNKDGNYTEFVPPPVFIYFQLEDSERNNLLDTLNRDGWSKEHFDITFNGKTYSTRNVNPEDKNVDMTNFQGLIKVYVNTGQPERVPMLYFGNFDGLKDYDTDLVLTLPGDRTETMHLKNTVTRNATGTAATAAVRTLKVRDEYATQMPVVLQYSLDE